MWDIFKRFLVLGCISFGGPAAHIAYFREAFVQRLAWLSERQYAEFVALSQFLPGPGSSQVGFAIGYHRAGIKGAISAFLGFTLPSIFLMLMLVISADYLSESDIFQSIISCLKILAVVVVFDAILMMYKNFCKDKTTVLLCLFTACTVLVWTNILGQILTLVVAALVGILCLQETTGDHSKKKRHCLIKSSLSSINYLPLALFLSLLALPTLLSIYIPTVEVFSEFFQAGSLVFGGGHVVLPLLQSIVGSQLGAEQFLTGYAMAQAVPGPMFTFATYIGYFLLPSVPIIGALVATIAIFLPGFLLLLSCLKNWQRLAKNTCINAAMSGVNAAVVGLLISALYQPVFISAVFNGLDMAMLLIGLYLLKCQKVSILFLVLIFIISGGLLGLYSQVTL